MKNKYHLTYDQLHKDTFDLSRRLKPLANKDTELLCITRGGLFVGGLLSYFLDIRKVHVIGIESYVDGKQLEPRFTSTPDNLDPLKEYIVIDDLFDTGRTLEFIVENFLHKNNLHFSLVTLYNKNKGRNLTPDIYGKIIPNNQWVVFPWD